MNEEHLKKLTKKETEIVKCLCKGLTTTAICYELNIKNPTLKVHLYNMFRKLNVKSRHQLVALILDGGLLLEE